MKKALLFLLSLLMVFSFVSCNSDTPQDHTPADSTINITVDIKTDSAIKTIQQYGQFFAVILTDNGGTYDFVKAYEITDQKFTINESVTLTSDKTDVYVYVAASDMIDSQQNNVNKAAHNTDIANADVTVSITTSNGNTIRETKSVNLFIEKILFCGEDESEEYMQINSSDIFKAVGESRTSFHFDSTDTSYEKTVGEFKIVYDSPLSYGIQGESKNITELVKDDHADSTEYVGIKYLSGKPKSEIFDFPDETERAIQYGDIFYLDYSDLSEKENKEVKAAFDKGAFIMMNGGNLDSVKKLFAAIDVEESYITIDKMASDKYVWFVGKYATSVDESEYECVFFDYLDTTEASSSAVALMGRYIVTSFHSMKNEVNNDVDNISRGLGDSEDLLKRYAAAVRVSQKLYQKVPIKYTWNYIRWGWENALKNYEGLGEGGYITDVHYRTLSIWFIHEYPEDKKETGTHYYYVLDSPSFNYSPTYFGVVNQCVGNAWSPYDYFGGGGSLVTGAKTQEWYGHSATITFEPVHPEQVEYIMDSPKTQDMDVSKTSEITWGIAGKGTVGVKGNTPEASGELSFNLSVRNSMSWAEKGVQILRYTDASSSRFRWTFVPRGAKYWFAPFYGGGSSTGELGVYPSWSAITTLSPDASPQYIFAVSDTYAKEGVEIRLTMSSTLERSAGKSGIMCCVGHTTSTDTKTFTLPYDKMYDYEKKEPIK